MRTVETWKIRGSPERVDWFETCKMVSIEGRSADVIGVVEVGFERGKRAIEKWKIGGSPDIEYGVETHELVSIEWRSADIIRQEVVVFDRWEVHFGAVFRILR